MRQEARYAKKTKQERHTEDRTNECNQKCRSEKKRSKSFRCHVLFSKLTTVDFRESIANLSQFWAILTNDEHLQRAIQFAKKSGCSESLLQIAAGRQLGILLHCEQDHGNLCILLCPVVHYLGFTQPNSFRTKHTHTHTPDPIACQAWRRHAVRSRGETSKNGQPPTRLFSRKNLVGQSYGLTGDSSFY